MAKCKECEHCKMLSRANAVAGYIYGRGEFWCRNPETDKLPLKIFGSKAPGFIGFGTPEKESKIQVKTSPRWCPIRNIKQGSSD